MNSDKKGKNGMGIEQIREAMSKIREAHHASRVAGATEDDAATYVSTYSDIHGSRLGPSSSTDLPYRPMKKGSSNKNIESVGSVEESIGAGKRRGRDSIFASSFQAELTGLVGGKPIIPINNNGSGNNRAMDDSDVYHHRHHPHQQHRPAAGQAAINHNQREYRQQVFLIVPIKESFIMLVISRSYHVMFSNNLLFQPLTLTLFHSHHFTPISIVITRMLYRYIT